MSEYGLGPGRRCPLLPQRSTNYRECGFTIASKEEIAEHGWMIFQPCLGKICAAFGPNEECLMFQAPKKHYPGERIVLTLSCSHEILVGPNGSTYYYKNWTDGSTLCATCMVEKAKAAGMKVSNYHWGEIGTPFNYALELLEGGS